MTLIPQIDELIELRHRSHALGLAARHRVTSVLAGLYASVFRGQGMNFEETREYQPGDEIRYMDWRVTARTGTPHLKVFREERERAVMLCVDTGAHMRFGTRGTFKSIQAARAAALLGWAASINKDRVGALLYGGSADELRFFAPSRARRSFWRMLQGLADQEATVPPSPEDLLTRALDSLVRVTPTGGLVILVGDLNRDVSRVEPLLGRLVQRHEVVLVPVDDPADRDIPDIGRVVFRTTDGERREINTASAEGRARYAAEWDARRGDLQRVASRLGIALIPVSTRDDVQLVLVEGLKRQRRRGMSR
jgi:uncharacterized protein (DUF58 family)